MHSPIGPSELSHLIDVSNLSTGSVCDGKKYCGLLEIRPLGNLCTV